MVFLKSFQILSLVLLVPFTALAQEIIRPQPEISTGYGEISKAHGQDFMIVTANPYATKAGYEILKKGGSAVDAAITAQLVLGLVEPQSSGLGGGAFMLHYDAQAKTLRTYDARETAPALAGPFLFQQNGKAMPFFDAMVGGRAVGVPGIPSLLKETHDLHGKLTWMELFDEPIMLAKEGFKVSPRMAGMVENAKERLAKDYSASQYFLPAGEPIKSGDTLKNPSYESTLRDYAFYGPSRFYRGQFAYDIAQTVQHIKDNPGVLTPHDFASYEIKIREPVCGPYRTYIVCSMGEPSSGGLTILQALGMLERFDLKGWGARDARSWHAISWASALAFADRNTYMADPDFVNTPGVALIDPEYLQQRSNIIELDKPIEAIVAGVPESWTGPLYETGHEISKPGTTHISIIDANSNIVSMTSTIEGAFGAHVMSNGFLLNNQLTDFAFTPIDDDQNLLANMAEGGKRPRSSMSPTIVFDQAGKPVLVIGSAGGSRIIGYVLQRIIAVLDWGMDIDKALAMQHTLARSEKIETETQQVKAQLTQIGNIVELKTLNSGMTAIRIKDGNFTGAADPRREGLALGR